MHIDLPGDVQNILHTLWRDGHSAYVVGGCVRDRLMQVTPQDWDIATSAAPTQVKTLFARTVDTGLKHGTVTVLMNRRAYEVTTYRVDGAYLDGRRPSSVTFTSRIEDDLSRRDFTMNAIAYNPADGFVDPFGGQNDITQKIIRAVGRAEHRFNEDGLRMLRAVRFAGQLGFTVEPETLRAIAPLKENLRQISAERIREELTRLLTAPYPQAVLLLETTGLLPFTLGGRSYGGDLAGAAQRIEAGPKVTAIVYALFLAWAGDESEKIMRDLRFDNKTVNETSLYVKWLPVPLPDDRYEIKKILNQISFPYFDRLLALKTLTASNHAQTEYFSRLRETAKDIIDQNECFTLKDLAVNGNDLSAAGISPGKPMGDCLSALLDAVMRDPALNAREKLLARL